VIHESSIGGLCVAIRIRWDLNYSAEWQVPGREAGGWATGLSTDHCLVKERRSGGRFVVGGLVRPVFFLWGYPTYVWDSICHRNPTHALLSRWRQQWHMAYKSLPPSPMMNSHFDPLDR